MNYYIKDIKCIQNIEDIWNTIVDKTSYAWIWNTFLINKYKVLYSKYLNRFIDDNSFVIYQDNEPVGLAVIVFTKPNDFNGIQASYHSSPLPWPMIADNVEDFNSINTIMFDEIMNRVKSFGASKIALMLSTPEKKIEWDNLFTNAVRNFGFIDKSFLSHVIHISPETHKHVRKRYKRYIRKFLNQYKIKIINQENYYSEIVDEYMALHIKDTGAIYRPIETYDIQLRPVIEGEGFVVQTINKLKGKIVGMLIIFHKKNAAYDGSVAVDPAYKDDYISHIMKWETIKHLQNIGMKNYELGVAAITPNYHWQPEEKNYGISHFKTGWTQGNLKRIYVAEKYVDQKSLEEVFENKLFRIKKYFKFV